MDQGPLVNEQIEAGARFLAEFQKYAPLQSAFWLKNSEHGSWHLYVVSEQFTDENYDLGYHEAGRIQRQIDDPWLDVFQVKVRTPDEPVAQAVVELKKRCQGRIPPRLHDGRVGDIGVAELYIYRTPIPAALAEVSKGSQ